MRDNAVTSVEASRLLDAFEEAIDALRIAYEKYFLGVERQPPVQHHKRIKAQLRRLRELPTRSTSFRFRLNGLQARLVTYQHYWNRVLGQIEKGTYRRDLQKRVQRREEARTPADAAPAAESSAESTRATAPDQPPAADSKVTPRPTRSMPKVREGSSPQIVPRPPKSPPKPPPPPVPGMKTTEVRQLFQSLVQAKQAAGEDVRGLTVRALARKLSREMPKLRKRHGRQVELEVATVGGKVTLRARNSDE